MALQETPLSTKFEFGQNIMIKNAGTDGYLSVDLSDKFPEHVTESDIFYVTTAIGALDANKKVIATARSTMKLLPADVYTEVGLRDLIPRYGQKIYIVVSDALFEKPVSFLLFFSLHDLR
ncbi:hypothetical protein HK100_002255 [Physocladia obscura]|uniref:Uncharacterized protein n=1 Tax=Physocladia obscura TaxID=109957 RepID=A0AAD5T802_9FUNG|nr:hypothetical protein HK100_002255 [Physocladia obscura]